MKTKIDFDALNAGITLAEDAFHALALSVSAEVPIRGTEHKLGYGKLQGIWRLYAVLPARHGCEGVEEALLHVSLEVRIRASLELEELHHALLVAHQHIAQEALEAADRYAAFAPSPTRNQSHD